MIIDKEYKVKQVIPLKRYQTMGRSIENDISVDDSTMSWKHLAICANDKGVSIKDLNSRNGTFAQFDKMTVADKMIIRIGLGWRHL